MTISHTGIKVSPADLKKVLEWYDAALVPLTYKKVMTFAEGMANGHAEEATPYAADWWVNAAGEGQTPLASHHAFGVKGALLLSYLFPVQDGCACANRGMTDRATVDAFYKAAIAAGGKDNGAPGVRADYTPDYYAAFVLDPGREQH